MDEEAASKKQDTVASDVAKSMDEDDRENKLVYFFMVSSVSAQLEVISFDPHKEDSGDSGFIDKTDMINKDMPPDLRELWFYNIAALGSKIYFIGGELRGTQRASNKVFAFDTHSQNWVPSVSCLNRKRSFSVVLTHDNDIYLFGNRPGNLDSIPGHWAEVYDSTSDTWEYLQGGDPPRELIEEYSNIIPAVVTVKHKKMLLLCLQFCAVYGYSLDDNCWLSYIPQVQTLYDVGLGFDDFGLNWSATVAVLNNTLFWECFGIIYSYDFQTDAPVKAYALPNALEAIGMPSPSATFPEMTYLVDAGNGKLCLVYGFRGGTGGEIVRCHTLELKKNFELHQKDDDIYNCVPPAHVVFAMAMDRYVDRESERGPRGADRGKVQEREQYCYHSRGEKDDDHERRQTHKKKKKNRKAKIHKDKQKQFVENGDWKTHKEIAQLDNKPKDNAGASTSSQQDTQKSAEEEWKSPKKTARAMTASQAKDKSKLTVEGPSAAVDTTELVIHAVEHVTDASSRAVRYPLV